MADAWHHRSDAISSVGALLGIGASMLGFAAGDAIASLAICVIILKVAYDVMKDALNNMTDTPCDREFERKIGNCIEEVPGVVRIDARARASSAIVCMSMPRSPSMDSSSL